jgi:hypothetical protein
MKIHEYQQSVIQSQKEARAYIEHSEVKQYKELLSNAQWDDFYDRSGSNESRLAFDAAQKMIAEELAKPIGDALRKGGISENDFFKMLDQAENKFHYRFLEVLGKDPEQINSGWISKSLSRSRVFDAVSDEDTGSTLVDSAKFSGRYWEHEAQLAHRIFDIPIGESVIGFNCLQREKAFPLNKFYRDFAENGASEEFLGVMLDYVRRADGLRPHLPHDQIFNHVVAEIASFVYKDENIGMGDIARLRESGVLKPTRLWDTKFFNENYAPVNTDESVEKVKSYLDKYSSNDVFYELKDKLSRTDTMSYFLSKGSLSDVDTWKYGMAAFEIVTGERLSFQEARDLKPAERFSIASTQAYSDWTDLKSSPDDFRKIQVSVERTEDEDYKYSDGEKAVLIVLDCKSFRLEAIEEAMSQEMLKHRVIHQSADTQEGIWYELATDSEDHMEVANKIAKELVKKLEALNKEHILPGDVIKVNSEEAEDYELTNGKVAVVTDVERNGSVKLKGDKLYYPAELFDLRRKHQLSKDTGLSMNR